MTEDHFGEELLGEEKMKELRTRFEDSTRKIREAILCQDGWQTIYDGSAKHKGISLKTKYTEDIPIVTAKISGITQGTPEQIHTLLSGMEYYNQIDPLYISGKILQHVGKNMEVIYSHYTTGVPLVYDRDFVYLEGAHHHDNGSKTIVAFSVNHPAKPDVSGRVRGHIWHTGWIIEPLKAVTLEEKEAAGYTEKDQGPWSRCSFICCIDPCGWLPHFAVNQLVGMIPTSLLSIRKHALKPPSGPVERNW